MKPRIAIVAATEHEIRPFLEWLQGHAEQHEFQSYTLKGLQLDILLTGIGPMFSMYALMDYITHRHPAGWLQAGVGGAYDQHLVIGKTYQVSEESMPTFGAEDQDGRYIDAFDLGWIDPDAHPFAGKRMLCPYTPGNYPLPVASGMTSWYAHGYAPTIERLGRAEHEQLENMEGAAFFYVSLLRHIPFLCFRSISNVVAPRDKSAWKMAEAAADLDRTIREWLQVNDWTPEKLFARSRD